MPTKKSTAKAAVKVTKPAAKKKSATTTKKKANNALVQAPCEQCFWVTDGRVLSNLVELRDALAAMSDDVFAYHVTKERNDFADWIEQVLLDKELASALRKSKKPSTARDVVVSRLRVYVY